jgi:hypothetical protein
MNFTYKTDNDLFLAESTGYIDTYDIVRMEVEYPDGRTIDFPVKTEEDYYRQLVEAPKRGAKIIEVYPSTHMYDIMDYVTEYSNGGSLSIQSYIDDSGANRTDSRVVSVSKKSGVFTVMVWSPNGSAFCLKQDVESRDSAQGIVAHQKTIASRYLPAQNFVVVYASDSPSQKKNELKVSVSLPKGVKRYQVGDSFISKIPIRTEKKITDINYNEGWVELNALERVKISHLDWLIEKGYTFAPVILEGNMLSKGGYVGQVLIIGDNFAECIEERNNGYLISKAGELSGWEEIILDRRKFVVVGDEVWFNGNERGVIQSFDANLGEVKLLRSTGGEVVVSKGDIEALVSHRPFRSASVINEAIGILKSRGYVIENSPEVYSSIGQNWLVNGTPLTDIEVMDKVNGSKKYAEGGQIGRDENILKAYEIAEIPVEKIRRGKLQDGWFVYHKYASSLFVPSGVARDWIPDDDIDENDSKYWMLKVYIAEARQRAGMPAMTKENWDRITELFNK